jgi:hypothetical protein
LDSASAASFVVAAMYDARTTTDRTSCASDSSTVCSSSKVTAGSVCPKRR